MNSLQFKIIENKEEAKNIWEIFSPHQTIDDEWDFRDLWTKELNLPFHFIVGYDGDQPVGLLPLQLNTLKGLSPRLLEMDKPYLEFFAGIDTDDNRVFVLPGYEQYIPEFLKQINSPAVLTSLKEQINVHGNESVHYLDRFELDLSKFSDFETFLKTNLDGVSRQRLINRINKIERNYTVEVKEGTREDLEKLFQFSIDRFGERSSFHMLQRQQVYREFLKRFSVDLFTVTLNGETKAVSFCIMHNGSYISLNIGYDYSIRDISKFLVVTQIQRAMQKGCKRFDAGQGDNGWKEHFHLTKIPQYKLIISNA